MKSRRFDPRASIVKNKRNLFSQKLFQQWRACETTQAFFAIFGLIVTGFDYEINYSSYRTPTNCLENNDADELFRLIILFTSLLSVFFSVLRHIIKYKWENHLEEEKFNLPISYSEISVIQGEEALYKNSFMQISTLLEIAYLMIFPYPNTYWKFYVPLRINFEAYETCYTLLEVTYFIMYFRFIFLLRALANYTPYENYLARLYCKKHNVIPDIYFSFKCMFRRTPIFWTLITIQLPTIFFLGTTLRIFERPLASQSEQDFANPWNGWYLIFCMMSILGFGPIYPFTYYGRFIGCVLGYAIGRFGYTILFYKSEKSIAFDQKQHQAFISILGTSVAASVIQNGMKYLISRGKRGSGHPVTIDLFRKLKIAIIEFKEKKIEVNTLDNTQGKITRNLKQSINKIDAKLNKSIKQAENILKAVLEWKKALANA